MKASAAGAALLLMALCGPVVAEIRVILPLDGHFRAGQYMPVLLKTSASAGLATVALTGEGIVPSTVAFSGQQIIAPVLVISPAARELVVSPSNSVNPIRLALRELPPERELVGTLEMVQSAAPICFELLNRIELEHIDSEQIAGWLAAGVAIVVGGEAKPDERWPWQRHEDRWMLRINLLGPREALIAEAAYLPAHGWRPGMPSPLRRQVMLGGVLSAIAVLACVVLLRGRTALLALLLVCAGAIAAIAVWSASHSPLRQLAGQIVVDSTNAVQWDQWTYFSSARSANASMPLYAATRPLFSRIDQGQTSQLRLHWSDDPGQRRYDFVLDENHPLAFVSRFVTEPRELLTENPPDAATTGPFEVLAQRLYLRGDAAISTGFIHGRPTVIIR